MRSSGCLVVRRTKSGGVDLGGACVFFVLPRLRGIGRGPVLFGGGAWRLWLGRALFALGLPVLGLSLSASFSSLLVRGCRWSRAASPRAFSGLFARPPPLKLPDARRSAVGPPVALGLPCRWCGAGSSSVAGPGWGPWVRVPACSRCRAPLFVFPGPAPGVGALCSVRRSACRAGGAALRSRRNAARASAAALRLLPGWLRPRSSAARWCQLFALWPSHYSVGVKDQKRPIGARCSGPVPWASFARRRLAPSLTLAAF